MSSGRIEEDAPDVSFSAGGFLGIYHVGVAACLHDHAPHLLDHKLVGASAGAMLAASVAGGVPLPEITRSILNIIEENQFSFHFISAQPHPHSTILVLLDLLHGEFTQTDSKVDIVYCCVWSVQISIGILIFNMKTYISFSLFVISDGEGEE